MVLGFISLILTFSQYYIAKICVPQSVADTMLPCAARDKGDGKKADEEHRRRLLWYEHRSLSVSYESKCKEVCISMTHLDLHIGIDNIVSRCVIFGGHLLHFPFHVILIEYCILKHCLANVN